MVRSKIAFIRSADENVLATLQVIGGLAGVAGRPFTITEYLDENELLQAIVLARLDDETTVELVSRILLTASGVPHEEPWYNLIAGQAAYKSLGLHMPQGGSTNSPTEPQTLESIDLDIALEQTPVPLLLLEGPEHTIVFINDGYVQLLARNSRDQLLGRTLRDAMAELEGQPFFGWLDQTYRTGRPFVGREAPCRLYSDLTGQMQDLFFDFVYHPIRNKAGAVSGLLCQAADVTERVLDRQVREAREEQLYQQWAELDALYRTSPLGMMLLRASDLTIQRLNSIQAALLGGKEMDLIGRRIEDFYTDEPFVGEVLRQVVRDKKTCTLKIDSAAPSAPGTLRKWTWNLHPILNAVGDVESVSCVALETTDPPDGVDGFLAHGDLSSGD